jgi:hypothetical protein
MSVTSVVMAHLLSSVDDQDMSVRELRLAMAHKGKVYAADVIELLNRQFDNGRKP